MVEFTYDEYVNKFYDMTMNAWLEIIRLFGDNNIPNYECHQRFNVYLNCFTYGFTNDKSFDCAITCESLPRVIFEVSNG